MRNGSILQVIWTLKILISGWQKIPIQPMKLPFNQSRLMWGVHCLTIGLLDQFSLKTTINSALYCQSPWVPLIPYWWQNCCSMVLAKQHIMPYSMGNYAWVIAVDQRSNYSERTMVPCSPDVILWGHISDSAYQNNPCNMDQVTTNISSNTADTARRCCMQTINTLPHTQLCMQTGSAGANFQNFL